jgi:hypothetical protein
MFAQAPGQHPDPAYRLRGPTPTETSFEGTPKAIPVRLEPRALATIGEEDGDAAVVFGRITGAAFVDDTTIAILDATVEEVRLFTTKGRHLQTFGRRGSGPGEFRGASTLLLTPTGELVVADTRRTLQFFRRGPRGFEYRETQTLPVAASSMCYLGETLYINGVAYDSTGLIRSVDPEGKVSPAFGGVYSSRSAIIDYQVAQGRIVCDEERQLIYFMAGALLGEVHAYRPSGQEAWRVVVRGFRTNRVMETTNGMQMQLSPTGVHADAGLALVGRSGLLAQWTFLSFEEMRAKEPPSQVHSVWIDPRSGAASYVGTGFHRVADTRRDLLLEFWESPVPQVSLRRQEPVP